MILLQDKVKIMTKLRNQIIFNS